MESIFLILLFFLIVALAWFDMKTNRVPNRVSHLLLAAGIWLNFPGYPMLIFASIVLMAGWRLRWIGGGDVKLWLAVLWLTPDSVERTAVPVFGLVLIVSAFGQLFWRRLRNESIFGVATPGLWRVIPYAAWLLTAI